MRFENLRSTQEMGLAEKKKLIWLTAIALKNLFKVLTVHRHVYLFIFFPPVFQQSFYSLCECGNMFTSAT